MGYATVIFSNQSGVARGMFDEAAVRAVNGRMEQLLRAQNPEAIIERHEYCPFHPEAEIERYRLDSDLRKPRPGMIHRAAEAMGLDLTRSWVIGDAPRDIEAGKAAGCRTILFRDPNLPPSPAADVASAVRPDYVVSSLEQAMSVIEQKTEKPEARPTNPSPDLARLQAVAEQILIELKRRNEQERSDFSLSKLLAGIVQVLALAVLFLAYLARDSAGSLQAMLLLSLTLETLTIALLLMGRQK